MIFLYYSSGGRRPLFHFFLKGYDLSLGLGAWGREVGKQVSVGSMSRGQGGGFPPSKLVPRRAFPLSALLTAEQKQGSWRERRNEPKSHPRA